jgi:hypothetical protein
MEQKVEEEQGGRSMQRVPFCCGHPGFDSSFVSLWMQTHIGCVLHPGSSVNTGQEVREGRVEYCLQPRHHVRLNQDLPYCEAEEQITWGHANPKISSTMGAVCLAHGIWQLIQGEQTWRVLELGKRPVLVD